MTFLWAALVFYEIVVIWSQCFWFAIESWTYLILELEFIYKNKWPKFHRIFHESFQKIFYFSSVLNPIITTAACVRSFQRSSMNRPRHLHVVFSWIYLIYFCNMNILMWKLCALKFHMSWLILTFT